MADLLTPSETNGDVIPNPGRKRKQWSRWSKLTYCVYDTRCAAALKKCALRKRALTQTN